LELNDILLQLLSDFCFFFQQIIPRFEQFIAPFDGNLISAIKFIHQNDLILKQIIIIRNLLVELEFLHTAGLKITFKAINFFLLILGPIPVHIIDCFQSGKKYLLDPVGQNLQIFHFSVVEFSQFKHNFLEGFVDEMFLLLLC
jgi:hypothetical protein